METSSAPALTGNEDTRLAVGNALKLSGSLGAGWIVALAVRLVLPRALGPERFGALSFADLFTATSFALLQLGVDTYARTAVAVRPERAREFVGGVLTLRALLALALTAALHFVLAAAHRPVELQRLVLVLCAAQLLASVNGTLAALLHARGRIDGLAWATFGAKAIWGAGVLAALAAGGNLLALGAAMLASESVKTAALYLLARRELSLRFQINLRATWAALLASLPFFLNGAAHTIYGRLDVSMLDFLAGNQEVGFYGAASTLGQITAMATPLIGWVLVPLFSRAADRSPEELASTLRRSVELCLSIALPTSLALVLGADLWVRLLFGAAFAPAAMAVRVLAPLFVLTYVAVAVSSALLAEGRGWAVTAVSVGGLVINPLLNLALIPLARSLLARDGAGGVGCALAMVGTETAVTSALLTIARPARAFDRRSLVALAKMLLACAAAAALDALLPLPLPARLLAAGALYFALVLAWGAIRPRELAAMGAALRAARPPG